MRTRRIASLSVCDWNGINWARCIRLPSVSFATLWRRIEPWSSSICATTISIMSRRLNWSLGWSETPLYRPWVCPDTDSVRLEVPFFHHRSSLEQRRIDRWPRFPRALPIEFDSERCATRRKQYPRGSDAKYRYVFVRTSLFRDRSTRLCLANAMEKNTEQRQQHFAHSQNLAILSRQVQNAHEEKDRQVTTTMTRMTLQEQSMLKTNR